LFEGFCHCHEQRVVYVRYCRLALAIWDVEDIGVVGLIEVSQAIRSRFYQRKLELSCLDELSNEFSTSYGPKVETVRKPYAFVGFG
jgi:hypothetical protein